MARVELDYIKTRFEKGDRPTAQDFIDLIDTLAGQATDLGTAGNNEHEITGIETETVVDAVDLTHWRMLKYLVAISRTAEEENKFYTTEFTVLIDKENVNVAEYGTMDNDGDIGTVIVSQNGGNIELLVAPVAGRPINVRYARVGLKA